MRTFRLVVFALALGGAFVLANTMGDSSRAAGFAIVALASAAYVALAWLTVLNAEERTAWLRMVPFLTRPA